MNKILRPITPDGMCGYDEFGQLCLWEKDGEFRRGYRIGDVRGKTCRICGLGWSATVESLRDQQFWHAYEEWVHMSCGVRYGSLKERDMWYDALVAAKIRFHGLKEIPNGYWGRDEWLSKRPWYGVETIGKPVDFTLGCRKRVYHIGAAPVGPGDLPGWEDARNALSGEDVTKEFSPRGVLVHAWGSDKARDYLKRLSTAFGLDKREEEAAK